MKMMSTGAAAEELGVHANTLRNWEEKGLIRAMKLPSGYRFSREEVERLRHEMFNHLSLVHEDGSEVDLPGETVHGDY